MASKAVVCYSGGHSSALVAIEAVRKFGKDNVILLNHDISPHVEYADIKRFKRDVADYLDLEITPANHNEWETMTPIAVSLKLRGFSTGRGDAFCTRELKSKPFMKWLKTNFPGATLENPCDEAVVLYGFDRDEEHRILRKSSGLAVHGYRTDFPLAFWTRTIESTEELGISKPVTYKLWKHANCQGCLKAGKQHWYCVYCIRPDIWQEAVAAEKEIGYSIIKDTYLAELEPQFKEMRDDKGICPTEKENPAAFWAAVEKVLPGQLALHPLPCDCAY